MREGSSQSRQKTETQGPCTKSIMDHSHENLERTAGIRLDSQSCIEGRQELCLCRGYVEETNRYAS